MAFHNIPPNGFPDLPDMEELEAVVKDVNSLKTSVSGLTTDVSNLSDNKANQITIAPFFDPETSYEVGDLVYYNGLSYRCTNDHDGEWDADDFAATTIAGELDTLKSGLTSLISSGSFTVACATGKNTFERDTVVLVGGNDTLPPNFSKCLCMISGHSGSLNAPNTIETDGANTFIIQSVSAQNLRVTWLDLSNVPIVTN